MHELGLIDINGGLSAGTILVTFVIGIPSAMLASAQMRNMREQRRREELLARERAENAQRQAQANQVLAYVQEQLKPPNGKTVAQAAEFNHRKLDDVLAALGELREENAATAASWGHKWAEYEEDHKITDELRDTFRQHIERLAPVEEELADYVRELRTRSPRQAR